MIFENDIKTRILGGGIISIISSIHFLITGKSTNITNTYFKIIKLKDFITNISFFLGMIFSTSFFYNFYKSWYYFFELRIYYPFSLSITGFILSGFLIGFGSKMTKGCFIKHSLNGISSLNKRSLIICIVMLISCFSFAFLKEEYNLFIYDNSIDPKIDQWDNDFVNKVFFFASFIIEICFGIYFLLYQKLKDFLLPFIYFISGAIFAYGELLLNISKRHDVIQSFLILKKTWNHQIIIGIFISIVLNLILYQLIIYFKKTPLLNEEYKIPKRNNIDLFLFIGSIIYGAGIGLSGIFTGSCISLCYIYMPRTLIFILMLSIGLYLEYFLDKYLNKVNIGDNYVTLLNNDNDDDEDD